MENGMQLFRSNLLRKLMSGKCSRNGIRAHYFHSYKNNLMILPFVLSLLQRTSSCCFLSMLLCRIIKGLNILSVSG